jgi:hypothetical protein
MHKRPAPSPARAARCLLAAALLATPLALAGCWLAAAQERANGHKVAADYTGLADQSVAVVVYADQAQTDEFPDARTEISNFLAAAFRTKIPSVRLLDFREVTAWQDDTLNWSALPEKDIGKHFSADRVLYIELLDYSTRANNSFGDLQGHIKAQCKVFETNSPGATPAWSDLIEVRWPKDHPLDPASGSEVAVRKRALEQFSNDLVNRFVEHREIEGSLRDANQ